MLTKLCLLLCAGVLLTQGRVSYNSDVEVRGLIDDVEKALEQLAKAIAAVVEAAADTLYDILGGLVDAGKVIEEAARGELEKVAKGLLDQIGKLEQAAAEAAVDITDCIGDSKEEIKALPQKLFSEISDCVSQRIQDAIKIVNETVAEVKSAVNVVSNIGNEVAKCRKEPILEEAACLTKVAANISLTAVELPLEIKKEVDKAILYVATVKEQLAVCAAARITELGVEGGKIVAKVTTCALEKIGGGSSASTETAPPSAEIEGVVV